MANNVCMDMRIDGVQHYLVWQVTKKFAAAIGSRRMLRQALASDKVSVHCGCEAM